MGQEILYDEDGNVKGASFMDYFLPTAVETPHWETDYTVTPSPHHPIGAKGVRESPNVGSVPCFANAVNDAFKFAGSTHIPMPQDVIASGRRQRIWGCTREREGGWRSLLPPGEAGRAEGAAG
jgi:CO/xanthine dehydrogenase Mo-binding subunit